MSESLVFIICLAVFNVPTYLLVGKIVFGDFDEFKDCGMFWLKPDILSWLDGKGVDDFLGELKLGFYFVLCAIIVYGEFIFFSKKIPGFVKAVNDLGKYIFESITV